MKLVALATLATLCGVVASAPHKYVVICHHTSNEKQPYRRIVVPETAYHGHFNNPGSPKAGHELDLMFEGKDAQCPSPSEQLPTPEPSPAPSPTPETPTPEPATPVTAEAVESWGK